MLSKIRYERLFYCAYFSFSKRNLLIIQSYLITIPNISKLLQFLPLSVADRNLTVMDCSETIKIVILVLSLHSIAVKSLTADDTICDDQLNNFEEALSNREDWALFGENKRIILLKHYLRFFFFKFLTHGQNFHRVSSEGTELFLEDLLIA